MNILRGFVPRERVCAPGLLIGRFQSHLIPLPSFLCQAPVCYRCPLGPYRNKFHLTWGAKEDVFFSLKETVLKRNCPSQYFIALSLDLRRKEAHENGNTVDRRTKPEVCAPDPAREISDLLEPELFIFHKNNYFKFLASCLYNISMPRSIRLEIYNSTKKHRYKW
jgi:hypothetical protein